MIKPISQGRQNSTVIRFATKELRRSSSKTCDVFEANKTFARRDPDPAIASNLRFRSVMVERAIRKLANYWNGTEKLRAKLRLILRDALSLDLTKLISGKYKNGF